MLTILDTQTVLDWLAFRQPGWQHAESQLAEGRWTWVGSSSLREELRVVLERGFGPRYPVDARSVLATWDAGVRLHPDPTALPLPRLRCSDRSDQKFIDLALSLAPCTLVSRDKAVLKSGRRSAVLDPPVRILTPTAWLAELDRQQMPAVQNGSVVVP